MESREILLKISALRNEETAIKMAAYMRNKFPFLGVRPPERRAVCREFYRQAKHGKIVDWDFLNDCWENEYREMQYVAVGYLTAMQEFLTPGDVDRIRHLAQSKSWWDTIDGLDKIVGAIALEYPEVNETLLAWSTNEDFWLRRIAIDHQLLRKEKTDTDLLATIIENNLGQTEFFVTKAIGWSLRDYSKTDPVWVRAFLEKNGERMAPLSIREASKYL